MNSYKDQLQEDYLIHFDVPGMKWGRRKARETGGNGNRMSRPERKALRREQKSIMKDYNTTLKARKYEYNSKLSSGKLKGTERHPIEQARRDMHKKYGKKSFNDAFDAQQRAATKATIVGAGLGTLAAVLYAKSK